MKKIIDPSRAESFARSTFDTNVLHRDDYMWTTHHVPAIVPGLQLLCTALATVEKNVLMGINLVEGHFQAIVPVGSEVDFSSRPQKEVVRLTALANGADALGTTEKTVFSQARRIGTNERMGFYEGESTQNLRVNKEDLETFAKLTELPEEAVPALYAAAISTASIVYRINNPTSPSWTALHEGLKHTEPGKAKLPVYERAAFYFPRGLVGFKPDEGLTQRSAIMRMGPEFVVDTGCYDTNGLLCGARSYFKQNSLRVVIRAIGGTLDAIGKSGEPGVLAEAIARMHSTVNDRADAPPTQ